MCILKNFSCVALIPVILHYLEFCKNATGEIIVPPTDNETVVSQNVTLICRSNIKTQFPVAWYYLQLGGNKYNELLYENGYFSYENGHVNGNGNGHLLNYGISGNTSVGEFNLVISNVTLQNAGRYTCVDTSRSEIRAELIVYESNLDNLSWVTNEPPDGFVGANDCGIMPDTVRLSCSMSYRGNLVPELVWKQGNETLTNVTVTKNDSFIMSSIELRADEITSPDFQCKIQYLNSNIESKFIWLTTIHVLVVDTTTTRYNASCSESPIQSVDCAVTALHQCSYTWNKNNSDWSFSGSIFNFSTATSANEVSVYTCHAECLDRGTNCSFTPAQVAYTCDMSDNGSTNRTAIIVLSLILVTCAILTVIGVIFVFWRRRCHSNGQQPPDEGFQLEPSVQTPLSSDKEFPEFDHKSL